MSLTNEVKDELTRVETRGTRARLAEVAAVLRFRGHAVRHGGAESIEVELDHGGAARRLVAYLDELFDARVTLRTLEADRAGKPGRHLVVIDRGIAEVYRRTGLITRAGVAVVGLPPQVISGTVADKEAAWRGAFLAAGTLTEPGRSAALEVECPRAEAALALVGCARALGATAKNRESRGAERVVVRDGDSVGALLSRMGAHRTRLQWDDKRRRRERTTSTSRLANFDDANLRRSARAAVTAAARVERAMEILGDDVPEHLAEAGSLRVRHRQASLEELGRLADPPMTKDAIAGRVRRLLSTADKRAKELGVPDTHAAVTEEVLDEADSGEGH